MSIVWDNILHLGLSISVLSNCFTIFSLNRSCRENRYLTALTDCRVTRMEFILARREDGIQGVAENTKVEQ
jgi:hypothetical protein